MMIGSARNAGGGGIRGRDISMDDGAVISLASKIRTRGASNSGQFRRTES